MAKRVAKIYGGNPIVNVYEINDGFNLMILLQKSGRDLLGIIVAIVLRTIQILNVILDNKYDIVVGPVAGVDND